MSGVAVATKNKLTRPKADDFQPSSAPATFMRYVPPPPPDHRALDGDLDAIPSLQLPGSLSTDSGFAGMNLGAPASGGVAIAGKGGKASTAGATQFGRSLTSGSLPTRLAYKGRNPLFDADPKAEDELDDELAAMSLGKSPTIIGLLSGGGMSLGKAETPVSSFRPSFNSSNAFLGDDGKDDDTLLSTSPGDELQFQIEEDDDEEAATNLDYNEVSF